MTQLGNTLNKTLRKFHGLDDRYTVTPEFCGYDKQLYVARFCGGFVNSAEVFLDAVKYCVEFEKKRLAKL